MKYRGEGGSGERGKRSLVNVVISESVITVFFTLPSVHKTLDDSGWMTFAFSQSALVKCGGDRGSGERGKRSLVNVVISKSVFVTLPSVHKSSLIVSVKPPSFTLSSLSTRGEKECVLTRGVRVCVCVCVF